ncbi:MAG: DUF502 domain-containing protein [Pseudomonadota bacterium]
MGWFRRYMIAGLLIWLPIGVTVFLGNILLGLTDRNLDRVLQLIPNESLRTFLGAIPGLGVIVTVLILLFTGLFTANIVGRRLVAGTEQLLNRVPLVRTVYSAVKNFAEVVFSPNGDSFKRVLLIEYPRKGVWSLAFQTSSDLGEVQARTGKQMICTFVPTTPNPTSGFIIMVPVDEAIVLDMEVEAALKMIISLGVVVPDWAPGKPLPQVAGEPETP